VKKKINKMEKKSDISQDNFLNFFNEKKKIIFFAMFGIVFFVVSFCVILGVLFFNSEVRVKLAARQILLQNGIDQNDITFESKMTELCSVLEEASKNGAFEETKKMGILLIKKDKLVKDLQVAEKKQVMRGKREQPREIKGVLKEFIEMSLED